MKISRLEIKIASLNYTIVLDEELQEMNSLCSIEAIRCLRTLLRCSGRGYL